MIDGLVKGQEKQRRTRMKTKKTRIAIPKPIRKIAAGKNRKNI